MNLSILLDIYQRHVFGEETNATQSKEFASRNLDTNNSINSKNESNQWEGNDKDELKIIDDSNTIPKDKDLTEENTTMGNTVAEKGQVREYTIDNSTISDQKNYFRKGHIVVHFVDNFTKDDQFQELDDTTEVLEITELDSKDEEIQKAQTEYDDEPAEMYNHDTRTTNDITYKDDIDPVSEQREIHLKLDIDHSISKNQTEYFQIGNESSTKGTPITTKELNEMDVKEKGNNTYITNDTSSVLDETNSTISSNPGGQFSHGNTTEKFFETGIYAINSTFQITYFVTVILYDERNIKQYFQFLHFRYEAELTPAITTL